MKCNLCKDEMVECEQVTESGERVGLLTNKEDKIYLGIYVCENCGFMKVDLGNYVSQRCN